VFAALAVAALGRIGLTLAGQQAGVWVAWLPAATYFVSGAILWSFARGGRRTVGAA
jgi:hypothetical protein